MNNTDKQINGDRLKKIENKVDNIELAVIEMKMALMGTQYDSDHSICSRLKNVEESSRISQELIDDFQATKKKVDKIERFGWIITGAIVVITFIINMWDRFKELFTK